MFLDTSHNSLPIVLHNLHSAFIETATKMWTYARFLPPRSHPSTTLLVKTVEDLVGLAFALIKGKGRRKGMEGYRCAVGRVQVEWLALIAFKKVLGRRQSRYQGLLAWIDQQIKRLRSRYWIACQRMEGIVKEKPIDD
ncbi:hypothetical protein B0O99DRAFT_605134 [Bisporella sp. PMI_857]|nr:hypothetical protein B0O99DRAFT_605134 [Bisporella sp. PMI_857]